MKPIESLRVSGFRGIMAPLTLDFVKGKSRRSMVIYGDNGTGKSSLADAWEWLHQGKIEHLAREGAGESTYPHVDAKPDDTFVQCVLSDSAPWDEVCLVFDHDRITKPRADGPIKEFRKAISHRCHVRYDDLTQFVYQTKAERYDRLASLMGFSPQVKYQKALVRVLRRLEEKLETRQARLEETKDEVKELTDDEADRTSVYNKFNGIFTDHDLEEVNSPEDATAKIATLKDRVEEDPRAKELASINNLLPPLSEPTDAGSTIDDIVEYLEDSKPFVEKVSKTVDILLLDLFETGEEVLKKARDLKGKPLGYCPLCGRDYEGDLLSHVEGELERLGQLAEEREELEKVRRTCERQLDGLDLHLSRYEDLSEESEQVDIEETLKPVEDLAGKLRSKAVDLKDSMAHRPESLSLQNIDQIEGETEDLRNLWNKFKVKRSELKQTLEHRQSELESDEARTKLVDDHRLVAQLLDSWRDLQEKWQKTQALEAVKDEYSQMVDDYIDTSMDAVGNRFDRMSSNVQKYFNLLEEDTPGIGEPELRLARDQSRAVTLQVKFRGEAVEHAYSYLSDSQLNSFGLAVFLASVRQFNREFKFVILDDVINSFDAYKRPRVADLLKEHFDDFQVLVLTHDKIWFNEMLRRCPSWIRRRFKRFTLSSGPILGSAQDKEEEIREFIRDDRPDLAGKSLGPMLEQKLQMLCESFEVLVKYNRKSEYTLEPLLDRFRVRVKNKLGGGHDLHEAIEELQENTGFRNFKAHYKNPETPLTASEMRSVFDKWKSIEKMVTCSESGCSGYLRYDRSGPAFKCRCGKTVLK